MRKKKLVTTTLLVFLASSMLYTEANASNVDGAQLKTAVTQEYSATYYFKDVKKSHWAADSIKYLVDQGIMKLYEDSTFRPNSTTTREEAAYVIAKTMGVSLESDFKLNAVDIPATHPYYKEIRKLAELGIIENNKYFNPKQPLKRAHLSKMIALAYDIVVDQTNKSNFKDYEKNYWAKNYIESLADANIVNGTTASSFCPNNYVTRAQLAGLTLRGMDFKEKVNNFQMAYDYLAKDYVSTQNTSEKWTNEIVSLVNEERKKAGLQPLEQDEQLTQLAIIKAQDMIDRNYFEHRSPYYGDPWDMATLFDYSYTSFGENIARNFNTPKEVFNAWMASEKHRSNILKPNYTNIGVGIKSTKNGKYYWVQHFSSK